MSKKYKMPIYMNKGFWEKLNKPIFALAPMYSATVAAFSRVIAKYGKFTGPDGTSVGGPDVMYTEFVSAEGLASVGFDRLKHYLIFDDSERPIVAQIFGKNPEAFYETAKLLSEMGFDGIDLNLGCPDKNIMKQGSCAALFHNPKLVQDIVTKIREGAPNLPVSLKIRIGDTKVDWRNWIESLLETKPTALSIHLRTRKEMSKVPAHWEEMPKIMEFIKAKAGAERPLVLGNGDVNTITEAKQKILESGCDGVMLGRGIFGNPFLFSNYQPSIPERLNIMLEHTKLFEQLFAGLKPFEIMKKHYKAYLTGIGNAKELRIRLMETKTAAEAETIISQAVAGL